MLQQQCERVRHKCSWYDCRKTSAQPYTDGWSNLSTWGPHIPDGFYCKEHADAIEAIDAEGGLEDSAA